MSESHVVLRASELARSFGSRLLFRDLSLTIQGGESIAIMGPNGAGKSTLLRILGGLLAPSRGNVRLEVGGNEISREDHPLHVGIVAPYVNLYEGLSALENLVFLARLRGNTRVESHAIETLAQVGLGERSNDRVGTFSSGMVQRLRVAAAVLCTPDVLLLDEPGITLDEAGSAMVARAFDDAVMSGGIVIVATNVQSEAARCDRQCNVADFR